jgi:hypothetical protein
LGGLVCSSVTVTPLRVLYTVAGILPVQKTFLAKV